MQVTRWDDHAESIRQGNVLISYLRMKVEGRDRTVSSRGGCCKIRICSQ